MVICRRSRLFWKKGLVSRESFQGDFLLHQEALRHWGEKQCNKPRTKPLSELSGGARIYPPWFSSRIWTGDAQGISANSRLVQVLSISQVPCQTLGRILHCKVFCVKAWFKTCPSAKAVWTLLENAAQFYLCESQTGDFGAGVFMKLPAWN